MICPNCHTEIEDGSAFCSFCGAHLESASSSARGALCPSCGAELSAGAQFCSHCGAPVARGASSVPDMDDGAEQAVAAMWGEGVSPVTETRRSLACPSCGAPVAPTDPYCPACGVRLGAGRQAAAASAPSRADTTVVDMAREVAAVDPRLRSGSTGPMPRVAIDQQKRDGSRGGADAPSRHGAGRTVALALGIAAAAALIGAGAWYVADTQAQQQKATQQAQEAAQALHSVRIAVSAEGWDTEEGASRIPIHVVGTSSTGEAVDETAYVKTDGTGLMLRQGSYELSVAGSPIAADGTIYTAPDTTISISVATDDPASEVDATSQGAFELSPVGALDVTDDQIIAAYQLAAADTTEGAPNADSLRGAALKRRDDAAVALQEQQEQQQAGNARHVVADSYEFYMPAYWDGRVTVKVSGDDVSVCSAKYPDLELFNVSVQNGATQAMGDAGYACLGDVALGDGRYASVWSKRWGWIIANAYRTNSSDHNDYYTIDEADEIVDLQTGGATDYESIRDEMVSRDGESELAFVSDDYLRACIVDSLVPYS